MSFHTKSWYPHIWKYNMLSSHVKISPLLWLHNKLPLFTPKNCLRKMVWYFTGVYIINRRLHVRLEIQNFHVLSCWKKYFTCSLRSLVKHFSTLKEKFCVSACDVISAMYTIKYINYTHNYLFVLLFFIYKTPIMFCTY